MIDLLTRHRLVECPIGFYDTVKKVFYIVEPFLGVRKGYDYLTFIYNRQFFRYKIIKVLQPEDLAYSLGVHDKENIDADKRSNSRATKEPR